MNEDRRTKKKSLKEIQEYYMEDGYVVFTKEFLLKRGYCCERGCRHCPYKVRSRE